jgi:2-polyprenyl-6-methoxyphenol hydroxylase-like FAD-dependent oxidoreductase
MPPEPRVAIVGAGPVGLFSALLLAEQGVRVTILEAADTLPQDMRASTFHPPTLDMLAPSGIADVLIAQGHKAPQWQYYDRDRDARIVFDLGVLDGLTDHPYRLQCEQWRLTRAIADRISGWDNVDLRFGARVAAATQDRDGVTLTVDRDGERETVAADYVIAADGGRSVMRGLLGLPFRGETYPTTSVTAVVDHRFEDEIPNLLPVNYLWRGDQHFSLMRVQGQWRVGFSPAADETPEAATAPGRIQERLRGFVGPRAGGADFDVVHVGAYSVHRRIIDDFRVGRILFAGDAAHLNSPAGGMGMNSGIHDARALAEALLAVVAGGDDGLLDRYARRRREIAVDEVQKQSDINHRRHRQKDPEARRQVWNELEALAATPESMRAFLRRTSLIASLEREREIA